MILEKERVVGKEAKYVVRLTGEERLWLEQLVSGKRVAAAKALRARMLLKADTDGPAWTDSQIAEAFEVGESTVHRLRERLVQEGLEAAVSRKPHSQTKPRKLDGAAPKRRRKQRLKYDTSLKPQVNAISMTFSRS